MLDFMYGIGLMIVTSVLLKLNNCNWLLRGIMALASKNHNCMQDCM